MKTPISKPTAPKSHPLSMISTILAALLAPSCLAEVLCNPNVPPSLTPSLQSCDYAIRRLEVIEQLCGMSPIVFSPTAAYAPNVFSLPAIFIGAGPHYTPTTQVWCAIMILWQPRPQVRPAVEQQDVFRFSMVLKAANEIRDRCLGRGTGRRSMVGREWVEPNQWVDVQFGGVWGPGVVEGQGNSSGGDGVGVMLADGTNMSIVPSALNEMRGCGGLLSLSNNTVETIE